MSENLLYQMNSTFQPSQVYSSAPTWNRLGKEVMDIGQKGVQQYVSYKKTKINEDKFSAGAKIQDAAMKTYTKSLEIQNPNQRAEYFSKSMEDQRNDLLGDIMPENVDYANKMYNYNVDKFTLDNMKDVARYNGQVMRAHISSQLTSYSNGMSNSLRAGDLKGGAVLRGQSLKLLNNLQASGMNPIAVSNERIRLNNNSYMQSALGLYEIAKKNGDEKQFRDHFDSLIKTGFGKGFEHPTKYLSAQDIGNIRSGFDKIDRQYAVKTGLTGQQLKDVKDQLNLSASKTGQYDTNLWNQVLEADPKNSEHEINRLNNSLKEHSIVTDATSGDFNHLLQSRSSNQEKLNLTSNINELSYRKAAAARIDDELKLAKEDPLQYIKGLPQYETEKKIAQNSPHYDETLFNLRMLKVLGLKQNVFTIADKTKIVNEISKLTPLNAVVALRKHLESIPREAIPFAEAQLRAGTAKNPGLSESIIQSADQIDHNYNNVPIIAKAMDKKKLTDFPLVNNGTVTKSNIDKAYSDDVKKDDMLRVMSNNPDGGFKTINAHVDMVKKVAMQLMEDGESDIGDAMDKAIDTVNAGHNFHSYGNSGYTFSIPNRTSNIRVLATMKRIKDTLNAGHSRLPYQLHTGLYGKKDIKAGVKVSGITIPQSIINQYPTYGKDSLSNILVSHSHWINYKGKRTADDDGLMLVYTDGRGNTTPLVHNGATVLIRFKTIDAGGGFLKTTHDFPTALGHLLSGSLLAE